MLDEPTDLPEGAEVDVAVLGDDLTPEERGELHASLDRALAESDAGRGVDVWEYLDQLIYSQDEPIADWVCIPLYFVSKLARDNGMVVMQVGEGADEAFSGYDGYLNYLRAFTDYWTPFRRYCPRPLATDDACDD